MTTQQHILDFYAQPSLLTSAGRYASLFDDLPNNVNELVRIIQGLGIYDLVATDFYGCTIPDHRKVKFIFALWNRCWVTFSRSTTSPFSRSTGRQTSGLPLPSLHTLPCRDVTCQRYSRSGAMWVWLIL